MLKTCTKCRVDKEANSVEFGVDKRKKNGLMAQCRVCFRAYKKAHPLILRRYQLKRRNGISLEEYFWLAKQQNQMCALCHQSNLDGRALAVDHDHACCPHRKSCKECIRGLLCDRCNRYALPQIEKHEHLQNPFTQEYLQRRPFLQPELQQSQNPPLDQTPSHCSETAV